MRIRTRIKAFSDSIVARGGVWKKAAMHRPRREVRWSQARALKESGDQIM